MDAADGTSIVLGSTTVGLLIKEFFAWRRSRSQKTEITPDPLNVKKEDKFVTRGEFNKHVEQNDAAHTEIFRRLKETEQKTEHQDGKLDVIGSDVKTIKDILIGKALKK